MADEYALKGKINETLAMKAIYLIEQMPQDETYTIDIRKFKKDRSAAQRRLQHVWYNHIHLAQDKQETKKQVERFCKYTFGVPILIRDNDDFAKRWFEMSKYMEYESQIASMEFLEVTRHFKVGQNTEYLESMKSFYADLDDPVHLPSGDDLYYEAMGYKR